MSYTVTPDTRGYVLEEAVEHFLGGLDCVEGLAAEACTHLPLPKVFARAENFLINSPGYSTLQGQKFPLDEAPHL
tara:strand:- start:571 stop:795 length:225 start_codon:yes stop_codon:yes gene_type:complete